MAYKYIYFLFLTCWTMVPSMASSPEQTAQLVFDRLYATHGNFNSKKPKLVLVNSRQNVARYLKYNNTIELETQAFNLCRSFAKDSLDALAFLLAHEMMHALQFDNKLPKSSFISYDKAPKSSYEIERNADVQGLFVSYLAGYRSIYIIPEVIGKMYSVYGIQSKNTGTYPSEETRKNTYKQVTEQVNELIELFQLANHLSILEDYPSAIACLEYVSRFYQGKEIYNNLGLNYALLGLNFRPINEEAYIYPLELDWTIRIKKPKTGRGEIAKDSLEIMQQKQLFAKARENLSIAARLDPQYALADLNIFSVLIMMNELVPASRFYRSELRKYLNKNTGDINTLKIKSAFAILEAKSNHSVEAIRIWNELAVARHENIASQAQHNLQQLIKNKSTTTILKNTNTICKLPDLKNIPEANIKLRNAEVDAWLSLDANYKIGKRKSGNSIVYTIFQNDTKKISVQKISTTQLSNFNFNDYQENSFSNRQQILSCKKENTAFLLNEKKEIKEIIRIIKFKEIEF